MKIFILHCMFFWGSTEPVFPPKDLATLQLCDKEYKNLKTCEANEKVVHGVPMPADTQVQTSCGPK